jgi:hypothetical protein
MSLPSLAKLIKEFKKGNLSSKQFIKKLNWYPYLDLGNIKLDTQRKLRKGIPEVIYAPGKKYQDIKKTIEKIISLELFPLIITKAEYMLYEKLKKEFPLLNYNKIARIIYIKKTNLKYKALVVVISAGSSDIPIAEETAVVLNILGVRVSKFYDIGVAGIHRIFDKIDKFRKADCLVVVAGMDGILPSIIAGLVNKPIIAVPTSIGYGANFKGLSSLLTMLNSCSPGVGVVNIDNGFGAGYLAYLISKR